MYKIIKSGIKVKNYFGDKSFIGNIVSVPKNKIKNNKKDTIAVLYGVFYYKVKETKQGYKISSKNPIIFNS